MDKQVSGHGQRVFVSHWRGGDLEGEIVSGVPLRTNADGSTLFDTDAPFTMVDETDGCRYQITDPWNCTVEESEAPAAPAGAQYEFDARTQNV